MFNITGFYSWQSVCVFFLPMNMFENNAKKNAYAGFITFSSAGE